MKIVLSNLPREGEYVAWKTPAREEPAAVKYVPLGLLSLVTNITGDHEVVIFDPGSFGWSIDYTIKRIQEEDPDLVGLSAMSRRVYALNKILKNLDVPHIAVGGPHTIHYQEQILKAGADTVFVGSLADTEFNNFINSTPLEKGIINCSTNINDIKYPNRRFINMNKYLFTGKVLFTADNRVNMFSSMGCPNHCTFCDITSRKPVYKRPEYVVDEMFDLRKQGFKSIHFLDDNFNASPTQLRNIIAELNRRNWTYEWSGRGQVSMDLSLVPSMAKTGFKRFHVGIESFDQDILKFYEKRQSVDAIRKLCLTMTDNGIDIFAYLILGSPLENDKYWDSLPGIIKELKIKHPFISILFPEANTKYYQSLIRDGYYKKDIWAEYMLNPVPDFEIPYPYGEDRKHEVLEFAEKIMKL